MKGAARGESRGAFLWIHKICWGLLSYSELEYGFVAGLESGDRGIGGASHNDLSSLAYRAEAMRCRLERAAEVIGALSIAVLVAS